MQYFLCSGNGVRKSRSIQSMDCLLLSNVEFFHATYAELEFCDKAM
jgi:hypothetical protein